MSLLFLFIFFCFLRVLLVSIVAFFCGLFDPATWESSTPTPVTKIRPRSAHGLHR